LKKAITLTKEKKEKRIGDPPALRQGREGGGNFYEAGL